jgi:hypothetical protein
LRADREGILAARQLRGESRPQAGHEGNGTKAEKEAADGDTHVEAADGADQLTSVDSADGLFADEEMEVIRVMRAKVERVDARLTALQEWVAETRSWTERVELAQKAQRDLGRLVIESQARIDQQVRDAEERAARIVAEAEEQARQLLADAERAAAELAAAATRHDIEETPAPEAEPSSTSVGLSAEEAEADELYDAIELLSRTNAELVNELNALISTIPARENRH